MYDPNVLHKTAQFHSKVIFLPMFKLFRSDENAVIKSQYKLILNSCSYFQNDLVTGLQMINNLLNT